MARAGLNISVSTPRVHMPRFLKSALGELGHQRRRRYHRDRRGGVKAPQHRVAPGLRDRNARRDVFRKARRVAGGERVPVPPAVGAHRVADRAFGRDVDRVGRILLDAARNLAAARQREPQFRIGRDRDDRKAFRRQKFDGDARLPAAFASEVSVRTTPLTCGCQASVAMRTRISRPCSGRDGIADRWSVISGGAFSPAVSGSRLPKICQRVVESHTTSIAISCLRHVTARRVAAPIAVMPACDSASEL